jgi:hypothetical protein
MVVVNKAQKGSGQFLVFACCHHGKVPCGHAGTKHSVNKLVEIGPRPLCTITYQKTILMLVGLHAIFLREANNWCTKHCLEASKTCMKARGEPTRVKFAVRGVWTLCTIINQMSMFLLVGFHIGLASWAHTLVLLGDIEGLCLSRWSAWVAVHVYMPKIAYFVNLPIFSTGSIHCLPSPLTFSL